METLDARSVIRKNPQMYIKENSILAMRMLLVEEASRGKGTIDYMLECSSGTNGIYVGSGWSNKGERWNSFCSLENTVNAIHNEVIIAGLSENYVVGNISIKQDSSDQLGSMTFDLSKTINYSMKLSHGSLDLFVRKHKAYHKLVESLAPGEYQFVIIEIKNEKN